MLKEGRAHLRFAIHLYRVQPREGRHVLHEHPIGASSWKEQMMLDLLSLPNVDVALSEQCDYDISLGGGHNGERMRAKPANEMGVVIAPHAQPTPEKMSWRPLQSTSGRWQGCIGSVVSKHINP